MKKKLLIIVFEILCICCFVNFSVNASEDKWICKNCGSLNNLGEKFCSNCGELRYQGSVNEVGKINFVNGFFWDNSQNGLSENFMIDLNTLVVATNCISFYIPESWLQGFHFNHDKRSITFYCSAVVLSEGEEDGLLCTIYREVKKRNDKDEYYIGKDSEYWYYFETYSDHVDPKDKDSFDIYKEQSSEFDVIRDSILIEDGEL